MGADIHVTVERKGAFGWTALPLRGKWIDAEADQRSYFRFTILGYPPGRSEAAPLGATSGLPDDCTIDARELIDADICHSFFHCTIAKLRALTPGDLPERELEAMRFWVESLEHDFGPLEDADRVVWGFDN